MTRDIFNLMDGYIGARIIPGYYTYHYYAVLSPDIQNTRGTVCVPSSILNTDKDYSLLCGITIRALSKYVNKKIGKIPSKAWPLFYSLTLMRIEVDSPVWVDAYTMEKKLMDWL